MTSNDVSFFLQIIQLDIPRLPEHRYYRRNPTPAAPIWSGNGLEPTSWALPTFTHAALSLFFEICLTSHPEFLRTSQPLSIWRDPSHPVILNLKCGTGLSTVAYKPCVVWKPVPSTSKPIAIPPAAQFIETRPIPGKPFPAPSTFFNDGDLTRAFFDNLLVSSGIPSSQEELTIVERFNGLAFQNNEWVSPGLKNPVGFDSNANFSTNSSGWALALSQGMSSLINTYVAAWTENGPLIDPTSRISAINQTMAEKITNGVLQNATFWATTTKAHGDLYLPMYRLNFLWCPLIYWAALFSSSLLVSLSGCVLIRMCLTSSVSYLKWWGIMRVWVAGMKCLGLRGQEH